MYFMCTGSEREAAFCATTGATLALQGDSGDWSTSLCPAEKQKERTAAFWVRYCLDKCWSPRLLKPSAFPDAPIQGTIPSSSDNANDHGHDGDNEDDEERDGVGDIARRELKNMINSDVRFLKT
jgi:hypothetical protein